MFCVCEFVYVCEFVCVFVYVCTRSTVDASKSFSFLILKIWPPAINYGLISLDYWEII